MGLTVNYRFEFRGSRAALVRKLAGLKARFAELPVTSVGDVVEIERASLEEGYGRYTDERFDQNALGFMMAFSFFEPSAAERAMDAVVERNGGVSRLREMPASERRRYAQLRRRALESQRRRQERIARSGNGFSLRVDVGEGCEHFTVTLGRLGNGRLWRGARFTKTQYAEHFVDAHLAVVRMLDLCKEAGILKSVHDEGEFWETRDLAVLAKNINESTATIQAITGALRGPARKGLFIVDANIDRSANYMQVRRGPAERDGDRR